MAADDIQYSWSPGDAPLEVQSLDFAVDVPVEHSWTAGKPADRPRIRTRRARLDARKLNVVSMPIASAAVKTFGFVFRDGGAPAFAPKEAPSDQPQTKAIKKPTADGSPKKSWTRIRPTRDIIRLEDRLLYLLQPPLETVIAGAALHVPFEPFPYQFGGIAFLYPRWSAVLADEMGLGKTMQAVTTVRLLLRAGELSKVLLICPKPLVTNWQREFAMWAPEIPVYTVEGDSAKRSWQWQQSQTMVGVTLANYELIVRDRAEVGDGRKDFDLVVLDEAQRIKNRLSATSQAVRCISRRRSWAMTGTPVENSAEDIVGIFEFLSPGLLRSEWSPRRIGQEAAEYILRRTKDQVLTDLPPKLMRDADVDLTPAQRQTYDLAEKEGMVRLTEMGDMLTTQHVFELVLRLKQICNFDPATGESAKLERLMVDIEEIARSGQKAVIFSQWVQTLTKLKKHLAPFGVLEYHGKIPPRKRDAVIEQFRNDDDSHVILMSYGAGSVGLNLQFAQYLFLFDRWWNPAVEDQAINRVHRIGVAGPVTISRFLAVSTIEERIDLILREKRELAETILGDADPDHKLGMSQDELFGLFKLSVPHRGESKAA
jgi:SNF2 family DNA or RNA helicase